MIVLDKFMKDAYKKALAVRKKNGGGIEVNSKLDLVKADPDDNKIIECAIDGNVDFLITKDRHLLDLKKYKGIKIIKPEEFLKIISS